MEILYKVTFTYRDLNAPIDNKFGVLTSRIIKRCKQFKSEDAITEYVQNNKTIVRKGKTITLLYYFVEQYVLLKENEYSVKL